MDSLPDDWGRRLLIRKHNIPLRDQDLPALLLALGGAGLGALMFAAKGSPQSVTPDASAMDLDQYIAKFPSIKDDVNIVRIEAATMNLAARAGLGRLPSGCVHCLQEMSATAVLNAPVTAPCLKDPVPDSLCKSPDLSLSL